MTEIMRRIEPLERYSGLLLAHIVAVRRRAAQRHRLLDRWGQRDR